MDGAGATEANPAAELGSGEAQFIADHPQQRGVTRAVHRNCATVEIECGHDRVPPVLAPRHPDAAGWRRMADTFFSKSVHAGRGVRGGGRWAPSLAISLSVSDEA